MDYMYRGGEASNSFRYLMLQKVLQVFQLQYFIIILFYSCKSKSKVKK